MLLRKSVLMLLFLLLSTVLLMGCEKTKGYTPKILKRDREMIEKKVEEKWNENLKFIIFSEKETYKRDEAIYIEFSLKNMSKEPIIVNKRLVLAYSPEGEVSLDIIGPNRELKEYKYLIQVDYPTKDDFIILDPNKYVKRKCNINDFYSLDQIGRYKITATYEFRKEVLEDIRKYRSRWSKIEIPSHVWTGRVKSNTIEIEIIP